MILSEIINAWTVAFNPNEEELDKANHRALICETCEYKQELKSKVLRKLTKGDKLLNKYKCSKCNCLLSKKLFSYFKEACPMNKWEK